MGVENMTRFENKVVLITGAGNGIGKAAAHRFSAEGASVVLADWVKDAVEKVATSFAARTHVGIARRRFQS